MKKQTKEQASKQQASNNKQTSTISSVRLLGTSVNPYIILY